MLNQSAKEFFEAPFLRRNKSKITREPNQIRVKINGKIEVLCAVEGTYNWATHPLDFIHNASVISDVLVDGKKVTENYAFDLLCKIYGFPPDPEAKRVFCNHLLGNRIGNTARNQIVTCKLANGLKIQVSHSGKDIIAKTKNGVTFIAKTKERSLFTYRLANLIHASKPELERAALYWVSSASEYAVESAKVRMEVAALDFVAIEMLAKAVAFHENLVLVTIIGHYNAGSRSQTE
jgi:hypothetical protein